MAVLGSLCARFGVILSFWIWVWKSGWALKSLLRLYGISRYIGHLSLKTVLKEFVWLRELELLWHDHKVRPIVFLSYLPRLINDLGDFRNFLKQVFLARMSGLRKRTLGPLITRVNRFVTFAFRWLFDRLQSKYTLNRREGVTIIVSLLILNFILDWSEFSQRPTLSCTCTTRCFVILELSVSLHHAHLPLHGQ